MSAWQTAADSLREIMTISPLIFVAGMAVLTILAATAARYHDKRGTLAGPTRERRLAGTRRGGERPRARRTGASWKSRATIELSSRWR